MKAIISVYDKTKLLELAKALHERGIALLATEGTARAIQSGNIPVTQGAAFTGTPELLGGKVKTLHPRIHTEIATGEIGFVVVNLIPPDPRARDPLDRMDIGGVALIRNGIKHFEHVTVIVNPASYDDVDEELRKKGKIARTTNLQLAREAMSYLITYDLKIERLMEHLE
jgi:phosphoribosylaminoimidazolecarboxamide formyltransferase/IMP cyclohydrolase